MKKICFVTTTSITLKTFVLVIANALIASGEYKVYFICDNDDNFALSLPEEITYIPVFMDRGVNLKGFLAISKFKEIFEKERFDIVQYSTPNASLYASIAAKKAGIPIRLYAQWGIRYVGFEGVNRKIFKLLEKIVCKNSTDIRAVSKMNMEFAINERLCKKESIKLIGIGGTIGVSLQEFDISKKKEVREIIRNELNINDKFVFGFVGRFSRDKGSNELIEAIKSLDDNCILLCVGPDESDESVNKELYRWAKSSSKVIFTGFVEHSQLYKYYAAMDCFVHPTYREGFGMVLQEAGAMGCPIITTKIPGASEVMKDGKSCLLVEVKNSRELTSTMHKLKDSKELQSLLAKESYCRTEKYFTRTKMVNNLLKDYKTLDN